MSSDAVRTVRLFRMVQACCQEYLREGGDDYSIADSLQRVLEGR